MPVHPAGVFAIAPAILESIRAANREIANAVRLRDAKIEAYVAGMGVDTSLQGVTFDIENGFVVVRLPEEPAAPAVTGTQGSSTSDGDGDAA